MKELTIIIAVLLNSTGYILYLIQIKKKDSDPRSASWGLWTFLTVLNFVSYRDMSGNALASLQFFSDSIWCVVVVAYMVYQRIFSFSELRKDWKVFCLGIVSLLTWWEFKDATIATFIICIAISISFIPTIREVKKTPFTESPRSWWFCTWSYLFTSVGIYLGEDFKALEILDPMLLFVLHAWVAILARKKTI